MTATDGPAVNTASGDATVGAQIGTVHGGFHYYQVPLDARPEEKYRVARAHLDGGLPTTARKLLNDVVWTGRPTPEMWFYWFLAFFSGRSLRELSAEDRSCLSAAQERVDGLADRPWSDGIELICRLVTAIRSRTSEPSVVVKEFGKLDPVMAGEIRRHLERVLQGPLKDELWRRDVAAAEHGRRAGDRAGRVWKYFEADPAQPRTRPVPGPDVTPAEQARAVAAAVLFLGAAGTIGWLMLQRGDTAALMAGLAGIAGAWAALLSGAEWRFRTRRRPDTGFGPAGAAPPGGFADAVDTLYSRYAVWCAPRGVPLDDWLIGTNRIRRALRNELVEVYRESRTGADRVKWLIRFQMRDLRRQWADGTLRELRRSWRTPWPVRAATVLGAVAAVVGGTWSVLEAVQARGPLTAVALLVALPTGWIAAAAAVHGMAERKRIAADTADRDQRQTAYWLEYQRWQQVLADRPDDREMAAWLDCDRRLLMNRALEIYQLKWSDVQAYASLEAPAPGSDRARWLNGPWRYSRYAMRVFLLTADGVRQIAVDLAFAGATFHHLQRLNYRYDAIAAVRVTESDEGARTFVLGLINGHDIEVEITHAEQGHAGEDRRILTDGALDAAGLRNTLFVLEGVGAEGRRWWAAQAAGQAASAA